MRKLLVLATLGTLLFLPVRARAWSHQGHILMTRLACLRIINDPAAPAGLKEFLQRHMKYDSEACRKLALGETVGESPRDYLAGIDGACTLPDRVKSGDSKAFEIAPYGMPERFMHYLDLEYFAKEPVFRADLSNRPAGGDFPKDVGDRRYRIAGFLPFRVEEKFTTLSAALRRHSAEHQATLEQQAVLELGYLAHYLQDAHQPHHATVDFKSYSLLAGKVQGVHAIEHQGRDGKTYTRYTGPREVNPHGDMEFQLFADTREPRKALRAAYWKGLVEALGTAKPLPEAKVDFAYTIAILRESYTYLPMIGQAALKAYSVEGKAGTFDPQTFFTYEAVVDGKKLTILELIVQQNARGVLETERAIRAAWGR